MKTVVEEVECCNCDIRPMTLLDPDPDPDPDPLFPKLLGFTPLPAVACAAPEESVDVVA